eukprot:TRINITY_DN1606_c0_g2_i1.p3 TRINITY_DN1606_c0_g2~~TRINITY_DN1606_c0_g2_i1.p3  ORF type:complete len:206 (+),score=80.47 TRINITY_DN1606_c0_g2_i1:1134-1751(+)
MFLRNSIRSLKRSNHYSHNQWNQHKSNGLRNEFIFGNLSDPTLKWKSSSSSSSLVSFQKEYWNASQKRGLHTSEKKRKEEGRDPPHRNDSKQEETIFSKIIEKKIKADVVYEDDLCLAFRDVQPQAPTHILLIPKERIPRLSSSQSKHQSLLGHMMLSVAKIAEKEGLVENGFRIVINDGKDGCQSVYHLHIHIIGGRKMNWPPG